MIRDALASGGGSVDTTDDEDEVPDSRPDRARGGGVDIPEDDRTADEIAEDQDEDDGGYSVGIPGTDLNVTTDADEADVVSTDDVEDTARSAGGKGQDAVRTSLIQAPMSAGASLASGEAQWVDGDEAGEAVQTVDEGITEAVDDVVEGTAADNTGTDLLRSGTDTLVGEGVRNVLGTTTGIDAEEGDADFTTDRWAAADTALTIGTAGAGGAVLRGVGRGSDGASDVFRLGGRSGDDAAGATGRAADDAPALPAAGDDAAGAAARTGDDAAGAAARTGDEATGPLSMLGGAAGRATDDLAAGAGRAADAATDAAGRAGSMVRGSGSRAADAARSHPVAAGAAGVGGALVAGGAAHDELFSGQDEVELEDADGNAFTISRVDDFEPTEEHPTGGVLWRVLQDGESQGYTVVLAIDGEDVTLLGPDGGEMQSTRTTATELTGAAERARERRNENAGGAGV